MEALTAQRVQDAKEAIWPEEFMTLTAEEYERKVICAEHERSLGLRLERASWDAYCQRHGIVGPQAEVMKPVKQGFG